jgi:outer membrane protein assembly factor BamD
VTKFIYFFVLFFLISGCASNSTDPNIAFRGQSAQQIYQQGRQAFLSGHYSDAIKAFEALNVLHPFSAYSEQAQIDLIDSYYKQDDAINSEASIQRFIRFYPKSTHLDYVYYMNAMVHYKQDRGWYINYVPLDMTRRDPGTMRQSYTDFAQFIARFPNSIYVTDAQQRMKHLRTFFARYELHIADFYFRKKAYVAAANRAGNVIHLYPDTPQARQAQEIVQKSYAMLGVQG